MQVSHIHPLQYSLPDQRFSIFLRHEKHSILLTMDGAIAGYHLTIVLQSSDLNLWVFRGNKVLQASQQVGLAEPVLSDRADCAFLQLRELK